MVVSATDSSIRAAAPPETRRKPNREGADGDANATGAIAFDSLLNVARDALGSRARQMDSDARLSGQMFEDTSGTAREQRETALRDDYQRDLQTEKPSRYDRSGVGYRSQLAREAGDAKAAQGPLKNGAQRDAQVVAQTAPARSTFKAPNDQSSATKTDASDAQARFAQRTGETRMVIGADSAHDVSASAQNTALAGLARAPGAVVPSGEGRASETLANRVAQVLGAGRASGVESARAATAAPGLPESRDTKTPSRSPSESASSKPAQGEARADGARHSAEATPTKFEELVRSIRMRAGNLRSSARMLLDPPELGRVQIDVRMDGERLQIDVRTSNADARRLLAERSDDLRTALAEQGITVDRFDVQVDPSHGHGGTTVGGGFEQAADRQSSSRGGGASARARSDYHEMGQADSIVEDRAVVAERRLDIKV